MGLGFAFLAIISWGIGDFLIQKSARRFGDWLALFFITAFAAIALTPFVITSLPELFSNAAGLAVLVLAGFIILIAGLLDFEALKQGKLSVIEPIYTFEIIITTALAWFIVGEKLDLIELLMIGCVVLGIILVSTKSFSDWSFKKVEKGVFLAISATFLMGGVNFLFGVGSRLTDPLMVNWFTSLFMAIITGCYLIYNNQLKSLASNWRDHKKLIFGAGIFDAMAWVSYSYAMLYLPIAIATGITETYVVLASALGLIFNKEKLKKHQWLGFVITILAAISLAFIAEK
jgi:drug/metabolite transporter (DMT)-like permease